jgi:hypothetical protein
MQAVHPVAALPYWDFTIDSFTQSKKGINWKESHIFSDKWFGSATTSSASHAIENGKFAYTRVKKVGVSETDAYVSNPYGLLRSPWNVNDSPYVTRSAKVDGYNAFYSELPSCKDYMDCFLSDTMAVMNECLNGKAHGSVHVVTGGVWQKDISSSLIDEEAGYALLLMSKNLWRQGYVKCPKSCEAGQQDKCTCLFNEAGAGDKTAYEVLQETGMFNWLNAYSSKIYLDEHGIYRIEGIEGKEKEDAAWNVLLRNDLGNLGYVGEMFSSASPYDPIFWLIHGTVDRLVHWRRLIAHSSYVNLPLDQTWGYAHDVNAASDSHLVCDWSNIDQNDRTQMPTCTNGECPGTFKDDVTKFKDFIGSDTAPYTNQELFKFLSPLNENLPYTYDNFRWEHCDLQDFKFGVQGDGTVLQEFSYPKKGKNK